MNFVKGINFRDKRRQEINGKARETSHGGTIKPRRNIARYLDDGATRAIRSRGNETIGMG